MNTSDSSFISSNSNRVGGIAGKIDTMNLNVENCTVENMAITGGKFVGGIIGSLYNGVTFNNCSVKSCAIQATSDYVGALAGSIRSGAYDGTTPITIKNFTFTNTTVKNNEGTNTNQMFPAQADATSNARTLEIKGLGAMVGGSSYLNFDDAIAAATAESATSKTIYLYNNYGEVTITEDQAAALANAFVKIVPADANLYSIDLKISAENSTYKVIKNSGVIQVVGKDCPSDGFAAVVNNTYYSSADDAILAAASGDTVYLNAATNQKRALGVGEDITIVSLEDSAIWTGATAAILGTEIVVETNTKTGATTYKAAVTKESAFASIIDDGTTTYYFTLQDAFDAAARMAGTADAPILVQLVKDTTENDYVTVPTGAYVTLDLAGHTLANSTRYSVIINEGYLTITDSSPDGTGAVDATTSNQQINGIIAKFAVANQASNTSLKIEGGNFSANSTVISASDGAVVISGGTFTSTNGSCVYVSRKGSVNVTGGKFVTAAQGKTLLTVSDKITSSAPLTISGGTYSSSTITNNGQIARGMTVSAQQDGTFKVVPIVYYYDDEDAADDGNASESVKDDEASNAPVDSGNLTPGDSVAEITNTDGVVAQVSTDETGAVVADITVPEGVESSVVEIPAEGASAKTVAIDAETGQVLKFCAASAGALSLAVDGSVKVKIAQVDNAFADIPDSYWGAESIDFAAARGLFTGSSAATFEPDGVLTRQMAMTVLARLDGVDTTTGQQWYDAGVEWAVAQQLSTGVDSEAAATREQLVTMLWRLAGKPQASDGTLSAFPDAAGVSEWAKDAMAWATEAGIITGNAGQLDAQESATRAQAATILQRYIEQSLR